MDTAWIWLTTIISFSTPFNEFVTEATSVLTAGSQTANWSFWPSVFHTGSLWPIDPRDATSLLSFNFPSLPPIESAMFSMVGKLASLPALSSCDTLPVSAMFTCRESQFAKSVRSHNLDLSASPFRQDLESAMFTKSLPPHWQACKVPKSRTRAISGPRQFLSFGQAALRIRYVFPSGAISTNTPTLFLCKWQFSPGCISSIMGHQNTGVAPQWKGSSMHSIYWVIINLVSRRSPTAGHCVRTSDFVNLIDIVLTCWLYII